METTATKLRTILLVGILSISMLSAGIGSVGAAPAYSSIGSVNVDDRSAAGSSPGPPADPDEWDLRSGKHSSTMSAQIIIDDESVRGISITDDVNHEGRDVSIAKDALSGWIDEIPDEVNGIHEDGSRWSSEVRISGNRVIVYVPEFSTQTITFSSRVSITADPAISDSKFEYDIGSYSVRNASTTITGVTDRNYETIEETTTDNTRSVDVGGNIDATDVKLKLTGSTKYNDISYSGYGGQAEQTGQSKTIQINTSFDNLPSSATVKVTPKRKSYTVTGDKFTSGQTESKTVTSPTNGWRISQTDVETGYDFLNSDTVHGAKLSHSGGFVDATGTQRPYNTKTHTHQEVTHTGDVKFGIFGSTSTTDEDVYIEPTVTSVKPQQATVNPSDGSSNTKSLSGTTEFNVPISSNTDNIYISVPEGSFNYNIDYSIAVPTNNPSVKFNGKSYNVSGTLANGSTRSWDLGTISPGSYTKNISSDGNSRVVSNLSYIERTESRDPSITISSDAGSQTIGYSGTLADGSTADLSSQINTSKIGGNVSVNVSVSSSVSSGPVGAVGLDYSHDSQESKEIDYSGQEFSERYSFTYQWPRDRPSASITIPWASDRVVDVRSVKVNGQETTQYSAADGELTVDLGSVQSGDQTNVTAVGSKVSVSGGQISVDDPTTQGEKLDSKISIESLSGQTLKIDVSESYHVTERDRLVYIPDATASWIEADPITRIEPGSQTIEIDPTSSSSFRLRSAAIGSSVESGDAILRMQDSSIPQVSVSEGQTSGDTIKLTYHDTTSGEYYRVVDVDGDPLDTDQAESPAEFRISDTTGLFSIEQFTPEAVVSGISSGAAAVSSGDSLIPPWLALVATLTASVLGLAYVGTRTEIGSSMLGRRVIIGGGIVLGYVGAELVTGERLYRLALDGVSGFIGSALGAGAGAGSGAISGLADIGFISLVLGIGLLIGLYAIDQRTGLDIPRSGWGIAAGLISVWVISQLGIGTGVSIGGQQSLSIVLAIGIVLGLLALDQRGILSIPLPLYAGTALLAGVYVLETLAPGSVLGPLQSGLDEVGPLIWLAIIGGSLLLLWVWLRSNRPQIQILGRGGNQ